MARISYLENSFFRIQNQCSTVLKSSNFGIDTIFAIIEADWKKSYEYIIWGKTIIIVKKRIKITLVWAIIEFRYIFELSHQGLKMWSK